MLSWNQLTPLLLCDSVMKSLHVIICFCCWILKAENKKLAEPLRKAREQLVELQRQLGSQEKEKSSLSAAQSKLKISQKKVESLTWEVEVLHQKFERAIRKSLIKTTTDKESIRITIIRVL